ncbi:MAG: aminoacyl-tRNA hydrolase [Acholeplasmatales bacterium]|nr:MAG: aminoacyl-tRNA hydrolase [Acholeplasmatales bacterium]
MKLIVGLGNPGRKYASTRHNVGFMAVDRFAGVLKIAFRHEKKFQGELAKTADYLVLKPQTFMNLSGISVRAVCEYYHIVPEDVIVVYDDLDLPLGKLRLRPAGGAGGHKGIRSIISSLQSDAFKRVRIGIDRHPDIPAEAYVLQPFYKVDIPRMDQTFNHVVEVLGMFVAGAEFDRIMNVYNATTIET